MGNKSRDDRFDFRPLGRAIKAARVEQGLTREVVAERIGISSSYLTAIENKGRKPGTDVLIDLVRLFDLSADEFIYMYPDDISITKSSVRRQIERMLDTGDKSALAFYRTMMVALNTFEADRMNEKEKDL